MMPSSHTHHIPLHNRHTPQGMNTPTVFSHPTLRTALHNTACELARMDLNRGTAGNVSVRHPDGFIITPTGLTTEHCSATDMVDLDWEGHTRDTRQPSSEWRFHRDIYQHYPQAGAIIHTHSPFATALACLRKPIPPFHYMIARFGSSTIPCADYARFGTQALSDTILRALESCCACLMANHGMVVYGRNLPHTLGLAQELETLCEQYWRACQLGEPVLLSDEEMAGVMEDFRHYGQGNK